jgi:hypothetical protein
MRRIHRQTANEKKIDLTTLPEFTEWLSAISNELGWHRRTLLNQFHDLLVEEYKKGTSPHTMAERLGREDE